MNKKEELLEATIKALQGKLTEDDNKEINSYHGLWNKSLIKKHPVFSEKFRFEGTDAEFLKFLKKNQVPVDLNKYIDENNNMIGTLKDFATEYVNNFDYKNPKKGETILHIFSKNNMPVFALGFDADKYFHLYDEDEDMDEEINLNYEIEVIDSEDNDGECPYLSGSATPENEDDYDYDFDEYNLDEDELWITGWSGFVENLEDGPFKSFKDMDITCIDDEKEIEYDLPEIPKNIQKEFLEKVNTWIKENK